MKITVPDSLADITVKQYKLLAEIEFKEDSTEWIIESISLLCGLSKEQVGSLTMPEVEKISKVIARLNNADKNNQQLKKKIKYKGKKYGFHPNLSKLTVGEFADLETYCGDGFFDNLNEILCILYRPIKTEGGDFYTIEKYKGDVFPNYWDNLKMDVVLGAVNFFLSIGVTLTKGLASSLVAGVET
tara:strand:- start:141 stop:698 length:558 start_codon:yes stop_codon:yes gene_type:complete